MAPQNIDCDHVTIEIIEELEENGDLVDWDSVLVEHLNKEPVEGETEEEAAKREENANSGCLLENELSEEDFLKALEDTPLRQDLVVHGADQQKPDARAADMESETDETPEELSDSKVINPSSEESDVARVWSNLSGVMRWMSVVVFAGLLCLLAYALFEVYKIVRGILLWRRTCKVPAVLEFREGGFDGHIAILDINEFRFTLLSKFQAKELSDLLSKPEIIEFDLVADWMRFPVVLDPVNGVTLQVYFTHKLTSRQHQSLLSMSLIKPQFSRYKPETQNRRMRYKILFSRRKKIEEEGVVPQLNTNREDPEE